MFYSYREFRLSKLSKATQLLGGKRIEPESISKLPYWISFLVMSALCLLSSPPGGERKPVLPLSLAAYERPHVLLTPPLALWLCQAALSTWNVEGINSLLNCL